MCRIRRPKLPFNEAKAFFSVKHGIYGIKKEVCVNARSGTAALISKGHPSSVHDITILRDHADEVNETLHGRSILADLGYRGAARDIPTLIVCGDEVGQIRSKRVFVECFFGRLKLLWKLFSEKWMLGEESFDLFFDIACAFTNLDIFHRPLRGQDAVYNAGVLKSYLIAKKKKEQRQKEANEKYRNRRRERLGLVQPDDSLE